ncbi:SpoIIE family protein phosphatase [Streptomyces sp. NPDC007861]|uniref:SpoIIE family protein phosphatase n=1 Tax=Streptomyces sp. NPDC007861 TaxID=3154893 RepID=UPI0033E30729
MTRPRFLPRPSPASVRSEDLEADLRADLQGVLALNGMGGFIWEPDCDTVFLDPGGLAVFDLAPDAFDGRPETLTRRLHPEDAAQLEAQVSEALASRDGYGAYFRVRRSDGSLRWAHVQGHIRRDRAGRPRRVVGIVRDASAELQHLTQQATLEADRRRQTDVVEATTSALSQALTIEDVNTALTSEKVMGAIGAASIVLSLVEKGRLRIVATAGLPPEYARDMQYVRLDDPLPVAEAIRTRKPRFTSRQEALTYPRLRPHVVDTDFTASAILPLIAQARPIGALAIIYRHKDRFTPEERNLLQVLGGTVAQSVQRAVLYDEEHAIAVGLQQAMLPAVIPEVNGTRIAARYRPARTGHQIGGDWYDVVALPTGRVGLVVGDVQGHDIHASAVMGQLRIALRAYAAEGHPPGTLLARASAFLHDLDTERFATCLYVELDPATGRAQLVRAGHHGPLVRHPGGGCSRPYVHGGLPLGLPQYSGHAPYPTTELRLGPEDTMLLCTDGLVEFRGMDVDEGLRQVETIVGEGPADLDSLAEHIVATVESRQGQDDDVALLLVGLTTADLVRRAHA